MKGKRYIVSKFAGVNMIQDNLTAKIFAFGGNADYRVSPHRSTYDVSDAYHLIDWLNERDAGYSSLPPGRFIPRP